MKLDFLLVRVEDLHRDIFLQAGVRKVRVQCEHCTSITVLHHYTRCECLICPTTSISGLRRGFVAGSELPPLVHFKPTAARVNDGTDDKVIVSHDASFTTIPLYHQEAD